MEMGEKICLLAMMVVYMSPAGKGMKLKKRLMVTYDPVLFLTLRIIVIDGG
jgi:hypothetical protein